MLGRAHDSSRAFEWIKLVLSLFVIPLMVTVIDLREGKALQAAELINMHAELAQLFLGGSVALPHRQPLRIALANQGLSLGLLEGLAKVVYPQGSNMVVFVIMIAVLLIKPAGLLGRER